MCGRYRLSRPAQLVEYFEAEAEDDFRTSYNIAPTQPVAAVRADLLVDFLLDGRAGVQADVRPNHERRFLSNLRWGLVPSWAKDTSVGSQMINARSETILEKPSFRESFLERRCLLPADGFYEWKRSGKLKRPFHFGMKDGSLFAFAGIWDRWKPLRGGVVESCSILTTTPNQLLEDIHDRMPVILPQSAYEAWLTAPPEQAEGLIEFLAPFDPARMRRYEVSSLVNSAANDSPECAAEVASPSENLTLWA